MEDPPAALPNVGPGPDPCSVPDLAADNDAVLLLLQRDDRCVNCREQVQAVADRYDEFERRDCEVVSVVPEPRETVAAWQDRYALPYPLLADPDATWGEEYDQPVRFGPLGRWSDFLGRMPEAVVLNCRDVPRVAWTHRGRSTFDRPDVDDLLAAVDEALERSPDATASP